VEVEVSVEVRCAVVHGFDDHCPGTELVTASYAAVKRVDKKVPAKGTPLFAQVDHQACEQDNGHRVRYPAS
jgi:hypothetical protein